MRMQYGSYQHDDSEVTPMFSRDALTDAAQRLYGWTYRWDLAGFKQAADAAALTTALAALEEAYAVNGLDAEFLLNSGQPSVHRLPGITPLGGTRVVKPVSYPAGGGAEYTTYRTYTVSLECPVLLPTVSPLSLRDWHQTIRFMGGGPRYVWLEPRNGLPQRQLVSQATTYRAVQTGYAVGLAFRPIPPDPLWPDYLLPAEKEAAKESPLRELDAYRDYRTEWSYHFESALPLFGEPGLWPY